MEEKLFCDYEFQRAAEAEDGRGMERSVLGFLTVLLNTWLGESRQGFERFLRIFRQKYERAVRALGQRSQRETCAFYLGALFGACRVLEELYRAEDEDERLVEIFAQQSSRGEEILLCLYRSNGGSGMRHGELAEALNISYSALTNAMKRVLQSGAVEAARYGKNTFYTLTKAGRRYCAERASKAAVLTKSQLVTEFLRTFVAPELKLEKILEAQLSVDGVRRDDLRVHDASQFGDDLYINLESNPTPVLSEVAYGYNLSPCDMTGYWSNMDRADAAAGI